MIAINAILIAVALFGAHVIRQRGLSSAGAAASWMLSLLAFAGVAALVARSSWLSAAFVLVLAVILILVPVWSSALRRTGKPVSPELARKRPGFAMKREEALEVLDLRDPIMPQKLEQAYKAKMRQAHPDLGGSHDQAAKINMARQVLEKAMFVSTASA